MVSTPAVVIAAPASGSGKTTIATGLMGALRAAGHAVAGFKVGPDFIDPGYHALATGRPGRNLDPVLVGPDLIGPLYRHGSDDADIAVIEGVMGLFDGRIEPGSATVATGSTAHVAGLVGAPVILVVDARGQSHSIAALLHGFATFDTATRIGGVILNRVGSPRHEQVLRQACEAAGIEVLGECDADLFCDPVDGLCRVAAKVGEPCDELSCAADAFCEVAQQPRVCVPRFAAGQPCSVDNKCASGLCIEEVCAPIVPLVCTL